MRKVYYIYNPKTRTYDRIYPTVRQRILSYLRTLFVGMGLGAGSFIAVLLLFGSPSEKKLRTENSRLVSQYNILSTRLDEADRFHLQAAKQRTEFRTGRQILLTQLTGSFEQGKFIQVAPNVFPLAAANKSVRTCAHIHIRKITRRHLCLMLLQRQNIHRSFLQGSAAPGKDTRAAIGR